MQIPEIELSRLTKRASESIQGPASLPSHLDSLRLVWLWIAQDAAEPIAVIQAILDVLRSTAQNCAMSD